MAFDVKQYHHGVDTVAQQIAEVINNVSKNSKEAKECAAQYVEAITPLLIDRVNAALELIEDEQNESL